MMRSGAPSTHHKAFTLVAIILFASVSCSREHVAEQLPVDEPTLPIADTTPPNILHVEAASDNQVSPIWATASDVVTVRFSVDEPLGAAPEVEIANWPADEIVTVGEKKFVARRTIQPEDLDGVVHVHVRAQDVSGNASVYDGATQLAIDNRAPIIRTVSITSADPLSTTKVRIGDSVSIDFTTNESLSDLPVIKIERMEAQQVTEISETRFRASTVIAQGSGTIDFSIYVIDMAGNAASIANVTTDGSKVVVDTEGPSIADPVVMMSSSESGVAGIGDEITISFTIAEEIAGLPEVTVNDSTLDVQHRPGTSFYLARTALSQVEIEGALSISIEAVDHAGNRTVQILQPEGLTYNPNSRRRKMVRAAPEQSTPAESPPIVSEAVIPKSDELPEDPPEEIAILPEKKSVATPEPSDDSTPEIVPEPSPAADLDSADDPEIGPAAEPTSEPAAVATAAAPTGAAPTVEPTAAPTPEPASVSTATAPTGAAPTIEPVTEPTTEITSEPAVELAAPPTPEPVAEITAEPIETGLSIMSPPEGSLFGAYVEIHGVVRGAEDLKELKYLVTPTTFLGQKTAFVEGSSRVNSDGSFSILFAADNLSGAQDVVLTALYRDGSAVTSKRTLVDGGAGIPGIEATYNESEIHISFITVPATAKYRLLYASDGNEPDAGSGQQIQADTSTVSIPDVIPGRLYNIKVVAEGQAGEVVESDTVRIIPLTPDTLAPTAVPGYQRVSLSWNLIPGTDIYTVYRSTGGDFYPIAEMVSANTFEDSSVSYGTTYSYQIAPTSYGTTASAAVSLEPLAEPEERIGDLGVAALHVPGRSAVRGSYAYVSAGAGGLMVVDISDAALPVLIGSVATDDARDVAVLGDYVYVADGERGLKVVTIYVPGEPEVVGGRKTSDAYAVAVESDADGLIYAYIADGAYGIKIIDVTNPRDPERIGALPGTDVRDVLIAENRYLVAADRVEGISIYDLKDLNSPIGTLDVTGAVAVDYRNDIIAVGAKGLTLVSIEDPEAPVRLGVLSGDELLDVDISGDFVYAATKNAGLRIYDISSPRIPVIYDSIDMEGMTALSVWGSKVYVSVEEGLRIIENYTAGTSAQVASLPTDGNAFGIRLSVLVDGREIACIADHRGGVKVYTLENPDSVDSASLLASIPTEYARDTAVIDNFLIVADGHAGLKVYDTRSFRSGAIPEVIFETDTDGNARSLTTLDRRLYVADGNRGVKVYRVSGTGNLDLVSSLQTEYAVDVYHDGGHLYLADGDGGFTVFAETPNGLKAASTIEMSNVRAVTVNNHVAYVADSQGLSVIDVSDPSSPVIMATYESGYAEDVAVRDAYVYLAEGLKGLTVLDASNPRSPYVISRGDNPFAIGIAVKGNYALIVDSEGLKVLEVIIPAWVLREK